MVNDTTLRTEFGNISQRFMYKLMFNFSDFAPNAQCDVPINTQRKFHNMLSEIIVTLYNKPEILKLPLSKDHESPGEANKHPEWKKDIVKLEKELTLFFAFMHQAGKTEVLDGNTLTINNKRFNEVSIKGICKRGFTVKDVHINLMNEVGFDCIKTKDETVIKHNDPLLFAAWQLLAQNSNNTYKFAYGLYNDDISYWLRRIEKFGNLPNGFFDKYANVFIEKGFNVTKRFGVMIEYGYIGEVSGFMVNYDPINKNDIRFIIKNGIGFKAIAERFDELDDDVKLMIIDVSKRCNHCERCGASGSKLKPGVKPFTIIAELNGKKYAVCPVYPKVDKVWWHGDFNADVLDTILKFLVLQEKYGVNWKKKKS